ncbi:MAG: hypothetical protein ACKVOT_17335 [Polaromonas sp.]
MARISAADILAAIKSDNPPKLAIVGSSVSTKGRHNMLVKIRPSTLKRVQAVALGPIYLLIEQALLELCEDLEKSKVPRIPILASKFNPTAEDLKELEEAEARKVEGKNVNRRVKKGEPVWPGRESEVTDLTEISDFFQTRIPGKRG